MRYIGKKSLSSFIKILIIAAMIAGIAIMASLPWTLEILMGIFYEGNIGQMYAFFLTILYILGICLLIILNELRVIFNSLEQNDPFIMRNVTALKRIFIISLIICIIFLVKIFVSNSIMTIVALFVFFVAMLFSLVLGEVFKKAVEYKQDHDLTI